ncbi:cytochrome b subunit of succinate dehydrogenase, Sdh3p [Hypoxylon texense]
MASIDDVLSLQNEEGLGGKTTLDIQYPYSPLTPNSIIEDSSDNHRHSELSPSTASKLELESPSQQFPPGVATTPNVEGGRIHQLGIKGDTANEFDPYTNAAAHGGNHRRHEPRAPTTGGSRNAAQIDRKREKNRKAARKCRQRAKVNVEWLKDQEHELSLENKKLKCIAGSLRNEVLCLKDGLLTHSQYCDSEPIKSYLAKVASELVNKDLN